MTPKEKAKEIVERYKPLTYFDKMEFKERYIECALIAVGEILSSFDSFMDSRRNMRHELEIEAERYWQQVKKEINNL
jgi:hypothetical protein